MVKYPEVSLDDVFSALSDPTRRAILQRLANGTASVTEIAAPFSAAMSLPAISKHLRVLETAGLVVRERAGRVHHLRLRPTALKDAAQWLAFYRQFWDEQLDSLSLYLDQVNQENADEPTEPNT
jgi:DNA-binding transcriptional ArsR family regulator